MESPNRIVDVTGTRTRAGSPLRLVILLPYIQISSYTALSVVYAIGRENRSLTLCLSVHSAALSLC